MIQREKINRFIDSAVDVYTASTRTVSLEDARRLRDALDYLIAQEELSRGGDPDDA